MSGHRRRTPGRRRAIAAVLLAFVVVAGLATHFLLPDTTVGDIAGDALYALAAYLLLVAISPNLAAWIAGLVAVGWCVAVELLQLTKLPELAAASFPPARLVLGSGFDVRDLVVYAAAVLLAVGTDSLASPSTRQRVLARVKACFSSSSNG